MKMGENVLPARVLEDVSLFDTYCGPPFLTPILNGRIITKKLTSCLLEALGRESC